MIACKCGSFKIENKELGLCASCNKERLKSERPAKLKKVYNLKRTPVNKVSAKKSAETALKLKTQKQMKNSGIRWCETCGKSGVPLSHSHIIPVGYSTEFEAVAENQIYECYGDSTTCHYIWEHGTFEQKAKQSTFARKIKTMFNLCPQYLKQFILNGTRSENYESVCSLVRQIVPVED